MMRSLVSLVCTFSLVAFRCVLMVFVVLILLQSLAHPFCLLIINVSHLLTDGVLLIVLYRGQSLTLLKAQGADSIN